MSDNRHVYRNIRIALKQLYPKEPQGNLARHLNTLAGLVAGIVQGKSCQLPKIAGHTPDLSKPESRVKRYTRWTQNDHIGYEMYYLPFIQQILGQAEANVALGFAIDGSEVGHHCVTLMVSLIYRKRAIPVIWLVVEGSKGHLPEDMHLELLTRLHDLIPEHNQVILLGDGEFDGIRLQAAANSWGWTYVCRTAKNVLLYEDDLPFSFADLLLGPGECIHIPDVSFTLQAYGPVTAIAWWRKGFQEPIYLVTNMELVDEACYWYAKRFRIETFFSDQKSRGFNLHKSHLSDPTRLLRFLIAACLAYLWIIYLGVVAIKDDWVAIIHRADRCDWSLFHLGLSLLEYFLNEDQPLPITFSFGLPNIVR